MWLFIEYWQTDSDSNLIKTSKGMFRGDRQELIRAWRACTRVKPRLKIDKGKVQKKNKKKN